MTDEQTEQEELAAQLQAATEALQTGGRALLREGEVHPQLVVLAAARVAGELGAGMALAGGLDLETTLEELAEVVRLAGREFHDGLQAEALPTAGTPEPGSAATGCDHRELIGQQELPAPVQQGQAASLAL